MPTFKLGTTGYSREALQRIYDLNILPLPEDQTPEEITTRITVANEHLELSRSNRTFPSDFRFSLELEAEGEQMAWFRGHMADIRRHRARMDALKAENPGHFQRLIEQGYQ